MNATVKSGMLKTIERTGMNALARHFNRNSMLVLGYHGILEKPLPQPFRYHHTAAEFRQHLEWLSRYCQPTGLDGMERWLNGEWVGGKPPAVITFDDGYRNNATLAADILSRAGCPAVFFLSTGYVGTDKVLWPDELFVRITSWPHNSIRTPEGGSASLPASAPEKESVVFRILQSCKNAPENERLAYLEYLRDSNTGVAIKPYPQAQDFMTWDEARGLAQRGFELGSHTVTHPLLSRLDDAQLRQELEVSRATIQSKTGARCISIAYPNGSPADYNAQVLASVEKAGYKFGFAVSGSWHKKPDVSRFAINRVVPPGHVDADTFSFHASGTGRLRAGL